MEQLKKGYKKTEVGVIPEDWSCSTIGSISLDLVQGINTAIDIPEYVSDGIPMLKANDIIDGNMILEKADQISIKTYNSYSERFRIKKNDFLFSNIGARLGSGTLFKLDVPCSYAWNVMRITPNPKIIFPDYFSFAINSPKFFKLVTSNQMGSGMGFVPKNVLKKLQIPLPPTLTEQKAIADALSDVDELIANLEKLIAKKKAIKQGAMQQLLTPKKDWIVKKISEIAEVGRGRVISHKEIDESVDKSYPVYSSQTSNDGIMGYLGTYDFDGEYVTWTTDGVNAGTVFYRSGKFNCTNVCGTLKLKRDNPKFIAVYLNTITSRYVSKNLANPKLMNDVMKKIEVCIPVDVSQQNEIAEAILFYENEISMFEKKLSKYKEMKQGMMQELLTGKTRLI